MTECKDDFADIIETNNGLFDAGQGGLDDGLKHFESVKTEVKPDGVYFEFICQGCKYPTHYTLEYPEVVALKFKISPHMAFRNMQQVVQDPSKWAPQGGDWHCRDKCRCGWRLRLQLNSREPGQFLSTAASQGFVNPQSINQIAGHCQQMYARAVNGGRR